MVNLDQLERADNATRQPEYDGYEEYQFQSAFDQLCQKVGGYRRGLEIAKEILKEQVQ